MKPNDPSNDPRNLNTAEKFLAAGIEVGDRLLIEISFPFGGERTIWGTLDEFTTEPSEGLLIRLRGDGYNQSYLLFNQMTWCSKLNDSEFDGVLPEIALQTIRERRPARPRKKRRRREKIDPRYPTGRPPKP